MASVHDTLDLGPTRVPIFVDLKEYEDWRQAHPEMNLVDFFGHQEHLKQFRKDGIDMNAFFSLNLAHNNCVIILNGIISSDRMRREVEKLFTEIAVAPPTIVLSPESIHRSGLFDDDQPDQNGGNQAILLTSAVGYYMFPLRGEGIRHVASSVLSPDAVRALCNPMALVPSPTGTKLPLETTLSAFLLEESLLPLSTSISILPLLIVRVYFSLLIN